MKAGASGAGQIVLPDDGMAEGGMLTEGALLHDQYSGAG